MGVRRWSGAGEDTLTEEKFADAGPSVEAERSVEAEPSAASDAEAERVAAGSPITEGEPETNERGTVAAAAEGAPQPDSVDEEEAAPDPVTEGGAAPVPNSGGETGRDAIAEEPADEEPAAEEPAAEKAVAEEAAAGEKPTGEAADNADEPDAEEPDAEEPDTDQPDTDYEILSVEDLGPEFEAGEDDGEDERPAGFDKRPDVFNWVFTPVTTLVVGPGLTALIGLFVAEKTSGYPRVCAPVRMANGCEEALLRMAAEHVVAFLVFWLLLWAMPWWRGLRAYRISLAVVAALILIAVPLRLVATIQLGDTY